MVVVVVVVLIPGLLPFRTPILQGVAGRPCADWTSAWSQELAGLWALLPER